MSNFIQTFGADGKKELTSLPIENTTNGTDGTFQFVSLIQDTVSHNITPHDAQKTTNDQSKQEHAELIANGATGVQIGKWAGKKFGISNWAQGVHHGEWQTLSTPEGDLTQLKTFLKKGLGIDWSRADGGSDNHSTFHLTDGYIFHALFGEQNMKIAEARIEELHREWQKLGNDYTAKAQFLKQKVGLDIKGDWSKLTGIRDAGGFFDYSDVLYASGSFHGGRVRRLWVNQPDSGISLGNASDARLWFLA